MQPAHPIFDFHTHAYPEALAPKSVDFLNRYYHVRCRGDGTMGDLLRSAEAAGVTHLLVHAVATKARQVEDVNTWIAAHLARNVCGFGTIHPGYGHISEELARIRALGLRGLKLHPDFQGYAADDPSMDAVYSDAEGALPVLIHAGDEHSDLSAPGRIARVLDRYPRLTVIAAHLGGYKSWDEAEACLVGRNCYLDTSSALWAMPPERAVRIIRRHGVERVLFGTDYPLTLHREELARFRALGLSPEEEERILWRNAFELLGLEEPEAQKN